jgi:hypothetical protein
MLVYVLYLVHSSAFALQPTDLRLAQLAMAESPIQASEAAHTQKGDQGVELAIQAAYAPSVSQGSTRGTPEGRNRRHEPRMNSGTAVAIAVDPVALITTECITVTSAMRKHARWSHSSVSAILGGSSPRAATFNDTKTASSTAAQTNGAHSNDFIVADDGLASRWGLRGKRGKSMQDHPLMSAFARLRSDLRGCTGSC